MTGGDLPTQLAADGPTATGHHDHLVLQEVGYHRFVQLHRSASQQVLYLNILHGGKANLTVEHLVKAREHSKAAARHLTDIENFRLLVRLNGRDGKNNLSNAILFYRRLNLISSPYNAHTVYIFSVNSGIVVNDAAQFSLYPAALTQFTG